MQAKIQVPRRAANAAGAGVAQALGRSLNSEILARLEADLAAPVVDAEAQTRLRAFVARLPRADHSRVARYKRQGRA